MSPRSKFWDIRANDVPSDLFPSGHVRISPHFYNTEQDGERVVRALREHREEGGSP